MHVVSTKQMAEILHFNDKFYYNKVFLKYSKLSLKTFWLQLDSL